MLTSTPLGLIYSSRAVRRAPDRGFAWSGFAIALIVSTATLITMVMFTFFSD